MALGERHGSKTDADFRNRLVRHPGFAAKADLIVVEFANAFHQPILDRYVVEGEDLPEDELARVWRDAAGAEVWESPIYRQFFDAVREANQKLAPESRLRVIAGDPAVDWENATTPEDIAAYSRRGQIAVETILNEAVKKGKKALLVWGRGHFARGNHFDAGWGGITSGLSVGYEDELFVVLTISGDEPKIVHFADSHGLNKEPLFVNLQQSPVGEMTAHEIFDWGLRGPISKMGDGLLFLGTQPDTIVHPDPPLREIPGYQEELRRRAEIRSRRSK
ncbi:MAG TPA: hypothetical protein VLU25_10315 [Acidobacteriota bacterium]|nr:hypothetical protein [Acidobacteriota bacterium]